VEVEDCLGELARVFLRRVMSGFDGAIVDQVAECCSWASREKGGIRVSLVGSRTMVGTAITGWAFNLQDRRHAPQAGR
jgi:hypothetical protein